VYTDRLFFIKDETSSLFEENSLDDSSQVRERTYQHFIAGGSMHSSTVEEGVKKLELIVYLIILVAFLGAAFNIPWALTNWIIQWLISALIGSVFSLVAGAIVEAFTGDFLKKITLTISIGSLRFSITAFALATFIVKVWLFGF
jgi:hypothetical protein